jgi:hypothetical protein
MGNELFNILLKDGHFLYNSIFVEQYGAHKSIFITPTGGRAGVNGLLYIFSGEIHYYVDNELIHKASAEDAVFLPKLSNYWCQFFKGKNGSNCRI